LHQSKRHLYDQLISKGCAIIMKRFWLASVLVLSSVWQVLAAVPSAQAASDDWPTYLHDATRASASADTTFSPANVANLNPIWNTATGGVIAASATVVSGVVYVGSWDGYEYAMDATTGAVKWKTNLGITTANPICVPPQAGVSSTAAVVNGVVYVGGGNSNWYALNATTGAVLWSVPTGDNSASGGHYNWSSPLIYNGFAYIGIASLGDCPLVQGLLLKVDLTSHQVVGTTKMVPDGQVGGGIWTTPALDAASGRIFVTTGTENAVTQLYAQAVVAIDAGSMNIVDSWKLPEADAVLDSDFSTSPTFYTDSHGTAMLASINKNGDAYALQRANLAAGPVWNQSIAVGGDCPTCGESSVSSGAIGGGRLYMGGETTTIGGTGYQGSVRALNPDTGAVLWQHPTTGPVIGHLTYANGVVYSSSGNVLEALDAATGNRLYSYDFGLGLYAGPVVAEGKLFVGTLSGKEYAFGLTTPPVPPADPNCPSSWTCQDVGTPAPAGSETVSNGIWTAKGGGAGITGTADSFRLMTQTFSGDSQVVARLTSQQNTGAGAQAGVLVRQNNTPGAPYYAVLMKPGVLTVQYRSGWGKAPAVLTAPNTPALPAYIEVQRLGDTLQAATSSDGTNWTLIAGTSATLALPAQLLAGLAVSSGVNGTLGTDAFSNVAISAPNNTPQPPQLSACPAGWSCSDVGNPAVIGDQSLSNGTWTVKGGGGDIWGTSDQFHYVRQAVGGDVTVAARITAQSNSSPYAKAGVMLRTDTTPGSGYYAAYVTPSNGVAIQYRQSNGYAAAQQQTPAGTVPLYLEVARSGNTFTTYTSTDGSNWNFVAGSTVELDALAGNILAGLAVTSHDPAQSSTATMTGVTIINSAPAPPNVCPSGWNCADIGFSTPPGDQVVNGGNWTVDGGGADIWDTSDQFRFESQTLAGDGSVSVHMSSQANTSAWAKSGLMMRLDNSAGSPYYAVLQTPSNGLVVQYRAAANGGSSQLAINNGTAPVWLKISRAGANFTAYTSTDGINWTAAMGSTVSMGALTGTLAVGMAVCSHDTYVLSQVKFDTFNASASALPAPWLDNDIGNPAVAGSATASGGTFTVKGAGNDIWGNADQFNYAWQPLNGDGTITAQVTAQANTDPWAKAGVMIKASTTTGSKYAMMAVTPGHGLHFQYNFTGDVAGSASSTLPVWVRLARSGNTITAYSSTDGQNWTQVGTASVALNAQVTAGMAVTSHSGNTLGSATFSNVSVTSTLPAPWATQDIGGATPAGSATTSGGTSWTVQGGGGDIWGNVDQSRFAYQPLSGDGSIVAHITSQDNTDPWAKAGVMIKESTTAGSNYALMGTTAGNGYHFQYNYNNDVAGGTYTFPNAWVKLTRTGNVFTAFSSPDGQTWTQVGAPTTITMNTNALVGLFVTSHNVNALSTAKFDSVSVTSNSSGALPSGWTNADIGSPQLMGSSSYNNGLFNIFGAGNDIWGTADQFQYAYKTLSGNGTITAQMASQANTDPWAKAGVMIRAAAAANQPYAIMAATPGNGEHFQYNLSGDAAGGANPLPVWVRLVRSGNTVTGYTSTNGTAWTQVSQVTLNLGTTATFGLFVCSHNGFQLGNASFNNVTVGP
jgi:outer membrane protein assembly factor BamB/regulation of enolase protein 1 (concanavalin A-like superfamily)